METNRKNLLYLFKNQDKIRSSDCSSDEDFKVNHINDFTSECIRKEKSDFEEINSLAVAGVCPSKHGGVLDYPKVVLESAALVTSKWDICYKYLSPQEESYQERPEANGLIKRASVDSVSEEVFVASVAESASKLILHHAWLTETLVKTGDVDKLVGVAGGLGLVRNKLWQFNEMLGGRPFQSLYKESCDLVESVCEQVSMFYSTSMTTVVLMDSDSQDWEEEKVWHEGERPSY